MDCPVCEHTQLVISSREGVEIDHCPQCRGVWLDRGELDKIIDRAAPSVAGVSAAPGWDDRGPGRDDRDRGWDDRPRGDRRRRRRSFLEELFDFD
jgi:Zn-finger nucleic acid-binding protein